MKKLREWPGKAINKYYENAEKDFYEAVKEAKKQLKEEAKNSNLISLDILLYYKLISKDNYINVLNEDLRKVIEIRKSIKS